MLIYRYFRAGLAFLFRLGYRNIDAWGGNSYTNFGTEVLAYAADMPRLTICFVSLAQPGRLSDHLERQHQKLNQEETDSPSSSNGERFVAQLKRLDEATDDTFER